MLRQAIQNQNGARGDVGVVLRAQKTTKTCLQQWIFSFFGLPQYTQPADMPVSSSFFPGRLTCMFASFSMDHGGSMGISGGQKMVKNGAKLHIFG